jgi:sigma-B regulation protein RsbU (phosphoserine phosphatase)
MHFNELTEQGLRLAVEEAVVNIMNYAYPQGTRAVILIEVDADADNETLTFVLRDEGVAFEPTAYQEVDVDTHVSQQKVGGLGIHLMRHYMDSLSYERKDGQNVLTMTKKIKGNQIIETI